MKTIAWLSSLFLAFSLNCGPVIAAPLSAAEQDKKAATIKGDVVLRAMDDELNRSMRGLKLADHPLPYFGSCTMLDEDVYQLSARFGAIEVKHHTFDRYADTQLRLGDKKLDNTAAGGMAVPVRFFASGSDVSEDDDYDALRRGLWLQTDSAYKRAIESLESARARLRYMNVEERPDSFSDAQPVVVVIDSVKPSLDMDQWQQRLCQLSAIFKQYPNIQESQVHFSLRQNLRRYINSEGTLTKTFLSGVVIDVSASAQCADGMEVNDHEIFGADTIDQLPTQEEMTQALHGLCKRVEELRLAKKAEDYQGPVLFEKQSASAMAIAILPRLVCARAEGVASLGGGSEDEQVLNKPVLADSISVSDDPTSTSFQDVSLKGGWVVDYEGVPGQKLSLIENGILKTLCSTRTPTRAIKVSNGHCRSHGAGVGHLTLTSSQKATALDLRNKLIALGKSQKLDSVLIVRRSMPGTVNSFNTIMSGIFRTFSRNVGSPSMVYRLDLNSGKEELLRGSRFKDLTRNGLLNLEAASDDLQPYTVQLAGDHTNSTVSIMTPSLLVKDLEVMKPQRTTEAPPYLTNPYFERMEKR